MTTLMSSPKIHAVPVREMSEPLVEIDAGLGRTLRVRKGVAARLLVARALLPEPFELVVLEGHRSVARQVQLESGYLAQLRHRFPTLADAQLRILASRSFASAEIAPHPAGAAVDVTIIDKRGRELDMGSDVGATPEESDMRCYSNAVNVSRAAQANRMMLANVMGSAGFVNYPTQWWHWSFGDRYWAYVTGAKAAIYGPVEVDIPAYAAA